MLLLFCLVAAALSSLFDSQSQTSLYGLQQTLSSSESETSLQPPSQPLWRECLYSDIIMYNTFLWHVVLKYLFSNLGLKMFWSPQLTLNTILRTLSFWNKNTEYDFYIWELPFSTNLLSSNGKLSCVKMSNSKRHCQLSKTLMEINGARSVWPSCWKEQIWPNRCSVISDDPVLTDTESWETRSHCWLKGKRPWPEHLQ